MGQVVVVADHPAHPALPTAAAWARLRRVVRVAAAARATRTDSQTAPTRERTEPQTAPTRERVHVLHRPAAARPGCSPIVPALVATAARAQKVVDRTGAGGAAPTRVQPVQPLLVQHHSEVWPACTTRESEMRQLGSEGKGSYVANLLALRDVTFWCAILGPLKHLCAVKA